MVDKEGLKTLKDVVYKYGNPMGLTDKIYADLQDLGREHIKELEKGCYSEEENNLRQRVEGKISWIKMFFNLEEG